MSMYEVEASKLLRIINRLLGALRSLPDEVTTAQKRVVHRVVLLTKIALAKLLQDGFQFQNKTSPRNFSRARARRRSIDDLYRSIQRLELGSAEKRRASPPQDQKRSEESFDLIPLKIRQKQYRGSMISLRQTDPDSYIIPEMARILVGSNNSEKSGQSSALSSSRDASTSNYALRSRIRRGGDDVERNNNNLNTIVDDGEWRSAIAPNGRTYYYSRFTGKSSWTLPSHVTSSAVGRGGGGGGGGNSHASFGKSGDILLGSAGVFKGTTTALRVQGGATASAGFDITNERDDSSSRRQSKMRRPKRGSWEPRFTEDGREYFYHAARRRASWIHPEDLKTMSPTDVYNKTLEKTKTGSKIGSEATGSRSSVSSLDSALRPSDPSDRKFISAKPGEGTCGGDSFAVMGEARSHMGISDGDDDHEAHRAALSSASDAISTRAHLLESEKAKWGLQKQEMETQIAKLREAVAARDDKVKTEHMHVQELEHKLHDEQTNMNERVREAERRRSHELHEMIDTLQRQVVKADEKCTKLESELVALHAGNVDENGDGEMTSSPVVAAALRMKLVKETAEIAKREQVRRERAMSMPASVADALLRPTVRGMRNFDASGTGMTAVGATNVVAGTPPASTVSASASSPSTNTNRLHLSGIDGNIASVATKRGVRSKVVALDGWQLWELVYRKAFVVDTFLQLRNDFAKTKEASQRKSRRKTARRSRARSRARSIPNPYPPLESFVGGGPKKGLLAKFWWDPIKPHMLAGSVFEEIGCALSSDVDLNQLREAFRKDGVAKAKSGHHARSRGTHHRGHLGSMETKMWIPFRRLNWTIDDLKNRMGANDIREMNLTESEGLTRDNVRMLQQLVPTPDTLSRLSSVERSELTKMETFILQMCESVPDLKRRLNALATYWTFDGEAVEHEVKLMRIFEGVKCILQSACLVQILHAVRTVGNYLNSGTKIGSQYAFSIASLTRLSTMKQVAHSNRTMIDFFVEQFEQHSPALLRLPEELNYLTQVGDLTLSDLEKVTSKMQNELRSVQSLYSSLEGNVEDSINGAFCDVFEPWIEDATRSMSNIVAIESELRKALDTLTKRFCPGGSRSDAFKAMFALKSFRSDFLIARQEHKARAERMKKKRGSPKRA
eukprot:g3361.t1